MSNWQKPTIISETKHYALCPNCGKGRHSYQHLLPSFRDGMTFGPWACDECGVFADFRCVGLDETDLRIDLNPNRAPLVRKYVLLERGDLRLIIERRSPADSDHDEYFYNEHTCPTNYLTDTVAILLGSGKDCDSDPHGVFQWVDSVVAPEGFEDLNQSAEGWLGLFGIKE